MTLHDFFLGGSALRVTFLCLGIAYCVKFGRGRSLASLCLMGSVIVIVLLMFSREWATLIGIPVTGFVVERLTEVVRLERLYQHHLSVLEDQHAINEHMLAELARRSTPPRDVW